MTCIFRAALIWLLVGLAGCYDKVYPPFVRNGLDTPVTLQVTYEDNVLSEGVLGPGMRLAFGRDASEIRNVVVLSADRELFRLDKQRLMEMKKSVPDERQVTWNIQLDGIKPLTYDEVQRLKKE